MVFFSSFHSYEWIFWEAATSLRGEGGNKSSSLPLPRVLARISKIPVQNSNFKISARPDLASSLLQILIPATYNSLVCQEGQFTLQLCPRRWSVRKIFGYYIHKVKIKKTS